MRQGRASEATEAAFLPYGKNLLFFAIWQKSLFIAGCVQASVTHLVCLLSVVCRRFFCSHFGLREVYMIDFHKPGVCRNGRARANAWDLFQCMQHKSIPGHVRLVEYTATAAVAAVFRVDNNDRSGVA